MQKTKRQYIKTPTNYFDKLKIGIKISYNNILENPSIISWNDLKTNITDDKTIELWEIGKNIIININQKTENESFTNFINGLNDEKRKYPITYYAENLLHNINKLIDNPNEINNLNHNGIYNFEHIIHVKFIRFGKFSKDFEKYIDPIKKLALTINKINEKRTGMTHQRFIDLIQYLNKCASHIENNIS